MSEEVAGGLDEPDELQPEQGALALASPEDDWSKADWERAAAGVLRKSGRMSDDDPDETVWTALTRTTYDGPLEVGEDLMVIEIGNEVRVSRGAPPKS